MRRGFAGALMLLAAGGMVPAGAVIQGTNHTAGKAGTHEFHRRWAQAALWREASLELIERVSVPMGEEIARQQKRHPGVEGLDFSADSYRQDVRDSLRANRAALQKDRAKAAGHRADPAALATERLAAEGMMLRWVLEYPDRFFRYGLYRQMVQVANRALAQGKPQVAVEIEAEAREVCARQYRDVGVKFLYDHAERFRKNGDPATATRYAILSAHYTRLAAEQIAEAGAIRRERELVAQVLANPASPAADSPLGRRVTALRLVHLNRPAAAMEAMQSPDPAVRRQGIRQMVRARMTPALLLAEGVPDPAVRSTATTTLEAGFSRGDVVLLHRLMSGMTGVTHGGLQRAHELLLRYTGRKSRFPVTFNLDQDEGVRAEWQNWWRSNLQPGVAATYYEDDACHLPLLTRVEPDLRAAGLGELPEARSGRCETILDLKQDTVYLLSLTSAGTVRCALDGAPEGFTETGGPGSRRITRLSLTAGQHYLQVDFTPPAGKRTGPALRLEPVIPSAGAAVRFLRHVPPRETARPVEVVRRRRPSRSS
jgi:hypothetical protein